MIISRGNLSTTQWQQLKSRLDGDITPQKVSKILETLAEKDVSWRDHYYMVYSISNALGGEPVISFADIATIMAAYDVIEKTHSLKDTLIKCCKHSNVNLNQALLA